MWTTIRQSLPADLVIGTTSDQQRQVREKLDLFNRSLWEAVVLVVLVSFVGFWEWRSALLMALSIPITLAMTFGLMQLVGLDIQQMSIASLIIALGLLVDDPVVAGDAIKRELAQGQPRSIAAWLGPDKLSKAILYATITNIAAYLPFLLLKGDVGRYIYSLPVTIACSLVASRVMSMTFLPLLAYYILKPERDDPPIESRETRFGTGYRRAVAFAIDHRWKVLAASSLVLVARRVLRDPPSSAVLSPRRLLSCVCRHSSAGRRAARSDRARRPRSRPGHSRRHRAVRRSHPRRPKPFGSRIGHVVHRCRRTAVLVFGAARAARARTTRSCCCNSLEAKTRTRSWARFSKRSSTRVAGARIDVRTVETGPPTLIPVSMRILGDDARVLRKEAEKLQGILNDLPLRHQRAR